MAIDFVLNGKAVSLDVDPHTPLLEALRNDCALNGPKFGCGLAQCGACSVLLNDRAIRACVTPLQAVKGMQVTTLEGLGSKAQPHPLQTAFIQEQAIQCGYCSNGMLINAAALLKRNPAPTRVEIIEALDSILCRCGAHLRILRAIERAAKS